MDEQDIREGIKYRLPIKNPKKGIKFLEEALGITKNKAIGIIEQEQINIINFYKALIEQTYTIEERKELYRKKNLN